MAASRAKDGKRAPSAGRAAPKTRLESARARMYHDLIFESAEQVFGQKGFDQATMQDIAQEAGVSLKTLYGTFAGKQELYDEIQSVRGAAFLARVSEATAGAEGARDVLRALSHAYAEFVLEHRSWLEITLHDRVGWGIGPVGGEGGKAWRAGVDNLAQLIQAGVAEGTFLPGDAETLAMTCLAVMQVQVSRALEKGSGDPVAVGDEVETLLVRLLCHDRDAAANAA